MPNSESTNNSNLLQNNNIATIIPDMTLYSDSWDLKDYKFSFKTADYINRWTGLNIDNEMKYDSGNKFLKKISWGGNRFNLFNRSIGGKFLGVGGKLGGSAGVDIAPGFVEAGFEVKAGYNLGQIDVSLPFSASVDARIVNNEFKIDVDGNFSTPQFDYTLPYAYAYLDAVLGYDLKVDAFANAFAELNYLFDKKTYSGGIAGNLIDRDGRFEKRLINLDTRSDDNFIDLIYKKINLGNDKEDSVPRSETGGFLGFDFKLPTFDGTFKPIFGNNFNGISGLNSTESNSGIQDEYIWEIKEEKELLDVDLALDNILAQIPFLKWLSLSGNKNFNVAGENIGLEYDWRAIALDLSASLSYGYSLKTGFTDLHPEIAKDKGEITSLIDLGKSKFSELTLNSFNGKEDLMTALESADTNSNSALDVVVEFDPKIIFEADAYLKPEIGLEWNIGVVKAKLAPFTSTEEFTLYEGNTIDIYSDKIQLINPIKKEVSFSNLANWLGLPNIPTEYTISVPFTKIDPERYPGTPGSDYIEGKEGDDGIKKLLDGNDYWVLSTGNDGEIDGGRGIDNLKLNRPGNYTLTTNSISDSVGNTTTFKNFSSLKLDGRQITTSGINIIGNLTDVNSIYTEGDETVYLFGYTTDFNDRIENSKIRYLDTGKGDDIVTGTLHDLLGINPRVTTREGNDTITVSASTIVEGQTQISAGSGDDNVDLTIVPYYISGNYTSTFKIDLDTGNDTLTVNQTTPIGGNSGDLPNVEVLVTGHVGGKTIDLEPDSYQSQVVLNTRGTVVRNLFGLEENEVLDRLFIDIADSKLNYSLANGNTIQDTIVNADELKLDLTTSQFVSEININPQDFAVSNLVIDGNGDLTEISIDTSNLSNINSLPSVKANNVDSVKVNSVNFDFLQTKLLGDFRTLDLSNIETGVFISDNFLSYNGQSLDIFEITFTDTEDTIYLSPNASQITTEGTGFNDRLEGTEALMSFDLGEGDDTFHDRSGLKDSLIYPGAGNDFIYGEGGFDEVFYEEGSRFDYQITVVDDRTVEVLYKPDNTIDTLIDVERINFDGADELVKNPFYQGNNPEYGYTTFTLQVSKADNWSQPPFVFSPFTYFVPFGTTEVTLTEDLLLTNVYDPEGKEDQLEISYLDVYTYSNSNPQLDTDDPSANVWQLTIPEGLNDEIKPVVIDSFVDKGFSSQGNYLEIYPSTELSYLFAQEAINLQAFDRDESIIATEFDDTVSSGSGDDTLEGDNGNDILNGEAGNDSLDGGAGNDSLDGGAGDDNLIGQEGNDLLKGNDGEDVLEANNGNDTLNGGAGKDLLLGGNGDDTYILQIDESGGDILQDTQGNDTIQLFTDNNEEVTISLAVPNSETIGIRRQDNNLIIDLDRDGDLNLEDDLIISHFFSETGDGVIETVANLSSDAIVEFLAKNSTNFVQGTNNNDDLSEFATSSGDRIIGLGGNDLLVGEDGKDKLTGNSGRDTLNGGAGNDRLFGGGGRDVLLGGSGKDILRGNGGADRFVFNTGSAFTKSSLGVDRIVDFSGNDKIRLSQNTFTALDNNSNGLLLNSDFEVVTSHPGSSSAEIVYNSSNGRLYYNENNEDGGFGSGGLFAVLTNSPDDLVAADFQVIDV